MNTNYLLFAIFCFIFSICSFWVGALETVTIERVFFIYGMGSICVGISTIPIIVIDSIQRGKWNE